MKKMTLALIALTMCLTVAPIFATTTGNGKGNGNGGGLCQNLITKWDVDPSATPMAPGSTGTYYLSITNNCQRDQDIKLTCADKNVTLSPASFTLKPGVATKVTVKVVVPAQNGRVDVWFKINFICTTGSSGKYVQFRIIYKDKPCCTYTASWVINPDKKVVSKKEASIYYLNITNKCSDSINFKLSSTDKNLSFSQSIFGVGAGKTVKITVTIKVPARMLTNKIEYDVSITPSCGTNKKLVFVLEYK